MNDRNLLRAGFIGSAVAAVCCFTPALVVLLGAVGLSALVGWWLDLILFPALAVFLGMTAYAAYRLKRNASAAGDPETKESGAMR